MTGARNSKRMRATLAAITALNISIAERHGWRAQSANDRSNVRMRRSRFQRSASLVPQGYDFHPRWPAQDDGFVSSNSKELIAVG
jgi:hypothetical protein